MKHATISRMKTSIMAIVVGLVAAHFAEAQVGPPERTLAGVWEAATTPRDCTTGDPIPAAAFVALHTFNRDGTLSSTASSGTPLPFHGLWRRDLGWSEYSYKRIRILRNPTTNLYSGKQEIGGTLTLSDSGDEYFSDEYMIVYSVDGVPGIPACLNSVGTRFRMDR